MAFFFYKNVYGKAGHLPGTAPARCKKVSLVTKRLGNQNYFNSSRGFRKTLNRVSAADALGAAAVGADTRLCTRCIAVQALGVGGSG